MTLQLQNSRIRDLAWVMVSPSLLIKGLNVVSDEYCQSIYRNNLDWLAQLDRHPDRLENWIRQNPSIRLGMYFEKLVGFWLQERIANGYFESHCRVFRGKRVLGELDFLFTEPGNDAVTHWETAVKFYLRYQDMDGAYRWYGPNARDRLDIKLDRLMKHQLCMNQTPEGQILLAAKGIKNVHSRAFMKGYLFYPSQSDWINPEPIPKEVAAEHLKGWWTRINQLDIPGLKNIENADVRWCILPRLRWLAPRQVTRHESGRLLSAGKLLETLRDHFATSQQSLLLAEMGPDEDGLWHEHNRGFIVSQSWPEISR